MLRLIRSTKLYKQLTQARDEYRSLKQAEHRASLRLKRAAVQARIRYEVQHAQLQRIMLRIETARASTRMKAAILEAKLQKSEGEKFKHEMVERVMESMPKEGDRAARGIAEEVFKSAIEDVDAGKGDKADMALRLVAGVAREAGVGLQELEQMVGVVEKDRRERDRLFAALRAEMEREGRRKGERG